MTVAQCADRHTRLYVTDDAAKFSLQQHCARWRLSHLLHSRQLDAATSDKSDVICSSSTSYTYGGRLMMAAAYTHETDLGV